MRIDIHTQFHVTILRVETLTRPHRVLPLFSQVVNLLGFFFQTITPNSEIRRRGENDASLQQRRQGGSRRSGRRPKGISDIMVMSLCYHW